MVSVRIMGWISLLMAFAILGMGGAPIAEKLGVDWLVLVLIGISYVSVAFLTVAALVVGGIGLQHGILVILGRDVATSKGAGSKPTRQVPERPRVTGPADS